MDSDDEWLPRPPGLPPDSVALVCIVSAESRVQLARPIDAAPCVRLGASKSNWKVYIPAPQHRDATQKCLAAF